MKTTGAITMTTSSRDVRACSKQLLESLRRVDALVDEAADLDPRNAQESLDAIAAESRAILEELTQIRTRLLALTKDGLTVDLDSREMRRAVGASLGELPLGPGCQALREVATAADRAKTAGASGKALLMVPLCIAYRQCLEALLPLATSMDPRDDG